MKYPMDFISEENFRKHILNTISHYGEKLKPIDLSKFNSNIIDPIKMMFDKAVYGITWEELINNEIFRQRDKTSNNEIGYFHQRIFSYMADCEVPQQGWDVIFHRENKAYSIGSETVSTIYVEMKNKHNTMNSASAGKTYIKMQNQLLKDDDCVCFLVEAIAKASQDKPWNTKVDGQNVSHKRIRRVSMDKFYEIITGDKDAFYKVCMNLPEVIDEVIRDYPTDFKLPQDTVWQELQKSAQRAAKVNNVPTETGIILAIYLLGFGDYYGFSNKLL